MGRLLRWAILIVCLLALFLPALADDDEEGGGNGGGLNATLQWRLACTAWDRREYDDAAAMYRQFSKANPDDDNAIEAVWRSYEAYRAYRPNQEKRKAVYEEAINLCTRWRAKYAEDNKERAARSLWYKSQLLDREGMRPIGIQMLNEMTAKFPGTRWDENAYWSLGEWLREAQRWSEAATAYVNYRRTVGATEYGGIASLRAGWCNEALGKKEDALDCYNELLKGAYNWGWWQIPQSALDAARRCRLLGHDDMTRMFALKIMDKAPKDGGWMDVQQQARVLIGEKLNTAKYIHIYPYMNEYYTSSAISTHGGSKLQFHRDLQLLVRLERVSKEEPFHATVTVAPKVALAGNPDNMKLSEEGNKKTYTATIHAPDARGNVTGDWWYRFATENQSVPPPDNLSVTRSWEKTGEGVGICTIRIQSSARWHFWIYLPNDKTNVNNLSMKPNEVNDNGRTFRWYDWYDLNNGMTIKFPVEVGNTSEYYPRIHFQRGIWGHSNDQSGNNATASYETPYQSIKITEEKPFAYSFQFPGDRFVDIDEIKK